MATIRRVHQQNSQRNGLSLLRHRVQLCSQKDVIETGSNGLQLRREGVLTMWAAIEAKVASTFSKQGAAILEDRNKRSHIIKTRYHRDLEISSMAWIYEQRLKSAPRWFKVLSVDQTEDAGTEFFLFDCRLVEKGDVAATPTTGSAVGLPNGLKL